MKWRLTMATTTLDARARPARRQGRVPRQHRGALHDRRRDDATAASRSSNTRCRRARSPRRSTGTSRGRVQLRARGPHGRAARRRRARGRPRRSRLQAARRVAHVLERRRRALPDPRDHRARRLRAASSTSSSTSAASLQADPAVARRRSCERYALEMDPASVPGLVERFGLRFPGGAAARAERAR